MLVIQNAKVYTMAGQVLEKGDIAIESGRFAAVGESLPVPAGAQVIDAAGLTAIPGIVDAHSHIGGFGSTMDDSDLNEMTRNATPEVESVYSIDVEQPGFKRVLSAGITTSAIAPGSGNVIGGLVCAVKSHGKSIGDMCIKNPIALKMALGGNPKGVYGPRSQMPMTRMGVAQVIIDTLRRGREYMKKQQEAAGDPAKMPPYDAGLENVCRALRREIPIKVHCEQFDMLTTIRIAREFGLEFTLDHAWGASDFYDEIAGAEGLRGVIFGPCGVQLLPGECGKVDIECLIELDRRGVCCSIMTDGPIMNPDLIVTQAGEAVRAGLPPERAVAMLTINPARIIGLEERIGSIEPGKDADVVLFSGMPTVDTAAQAMVTIVNGEITWQRS